MMGHRRREIHWRRRYTNSDHEGLVFESPVLWTGNWTGPDQKIDQNRPDFWSGCPEL
jgi:hypothetical protein